MFSTGVSLVDEGHLPGKKLGFLCFNRRKFDSTFQNGDSLLEGFPGRLGWWARASVSLLGSRTCWLVSISL